MLFNSLTFVVFFSVVLASYWSMRSWGGRKNLLLVASYAFYAAWNPPFVLLLLISSLIDFYAGKQLHIEERQSRRHLWLALSLLVNLGFLGFFKYGNFLMENFQVMMGFIGVDYQPPKLNVILPVGISFYTFQTLSYTFDIYKRKMAPTDSLRDFALYVSFFPQLVAGPIVRAIDFLPQCVSSPKPQLNRIYWGLFLMTLGLFQKAVLADTLVAGTAETIFGAAGPVATLDAWIGVLAFSCQIFFDFAGYSTTAIGAALCLGFSLPDNFRSPYAAVGLSDFWRRWHISLSTWLRDYLYFSIGGSRTGIPRTLVNLLIVMFLGGLWHGAAWTFVAWGVLHGIYLVIEHVLLIVIPGGKWTQSFPIRFAISLVTYVAVCLAWVFFRASDFETALRLLSAMGGLLSVGDALLTTREILQVSILTTVLISAHWLLRETSIETVAAKTPIPIIVSAWAAMIFILILNQGSGNAFIYFQF
jgi:alginate O-acetyltransferase complex protein AlgI